MRSTPGSGARQAPERSAAGFTILELVVVMAMMGILVAVALPRMRASKATHVRHAATQMAQDLELARTRALTTRRYVRAAFEEATSTYGFYLADEGSNAVAESAAERAAYGSGGSRVLSDGVRFGRGSAGSLPGDTEPAAAVTFADAKLNLNHRGTTEPFGTRGAIYLTHPDEPGAVSAIAVSAAGTFRVWNHVAGEWR